MLSFHEKSCLFVSSFLMSKVLEIVHRLCSSFTKWMCRILPVSLLNSVTTQKKSGYVMICGDTMWIGKNLMFKLKLILHPRAEAKLMLMLNILIQILSEESYSVLSFYPQMKIKCFLFAWYFRNNEVHPVDHWFHNGSLFPIFVPQRMMFFVINYRKGRKRSTYYCHMIIYL